MALGRRIIVWDAADMVRGASSSEDIADAGFSPGTSAVNLLNTPGAVFQPAASTDKSTNLTGEIIASCEGNNGGYARLYVSTDTDQDGRFYSMDTSGNLTARGSEDTTGNYVQAKTDAAMYKAEAYITNDRYVVRWSDIGGANTFNTTFFDFTSTSPATSALTVPHPNLVYEDNLYYGNANQLLRQTSAGGTPAVILTLPAGQVIVTLGIDAGSGKMLISIVNQINLSDSINTAARVGYYDGFSPKLSKVVLVESMITAFPSSEGATYAAYGNNLGYWNGNGVDFLRNFSNITATFEQLLYKQHFTNIGSTLYLIVRSKIWAHGPIYQGGDHVFYPAFNNSPGGSDKDLTHITNIGSGVLGLSYATSQFFTWSTTSVSTAQDQQIFSNEYDLKEYNDGAWLRRARIFLNNTVSDGVTPYTLTFYNQDGIISALGSSGVYSPTNTTGAATSMIEILLGGGAASRVYELRFRLSASASPTSTNPGIKRVEIFGDPANQP